MSARPTVAQLLTRIVEMEARLTELEKPQRGHVAVSYTTEMSPTGSGDGGYGVNSDPLEEDHSIPNHHDVSPHFLMTVQLAESVADSMMERQGSSRSTRWCSAPSETASRSTT